MTQLTAVGSRGFQLIFDHEKMLSFAEDDPIDYGSGKPVFSSPWITPGGEKMLKFLRMNQVTTGMGMVSRFSAHLGSLLVERTSVRKVAKDKFQVMRFLRKIIKLIRQKLWIFCLYFLCCKKLHSLD